MLVQPMDTTLQQLTDRTEIADLVSRLGRVLDEGRFDEMPDLLVEHATARTPGGRAEGRAALVAQASRNHDPAQPIQHLITNLLVDLDGEDRASARANLVVHFGSPDDPDDPDSPDGTRTPLAPPVRFSMGEVYRFGLVRTPDGWRFDRIETEPLWTSGTLPAR